MIRIGILGNIGSGKAILQIILDIPYLMRIMKFQNFIKKIKNFHKIKQRITKIYSIISINIDEISLAILSNRTNLKKIINIVHKEIRKIINFSKK